MIDNNSILQKLDGLEARYEEVSTLITDPDVIADQSRYVKLTKEYKDLGDIMDARVVMSTVLLLSKRQRISLLMRVMPK